MPPAPVIANETRLEAARGSAGTAPRTRPWVWVVLGLLVTLMVGGWVRGRIEEGRLRLPLQTVERASVQAHKPIGLITPSVAERWASDTGGPSEGRVRALSEPGNAYLEPAFYYYAGRHGGGDAWTPPAGARCYYLAVQRGRDFDAGLVTALARFCYVDGTRGPYEEGWTAIQ